MPQHNNNQTAPVNVNSAFQQGPPLKSNAVSLRAFAIPLIAAMVAAFLWQTIALSLGHEFGLLAWAVGAAVGATAAISGGNGKVIGGYCALLALLAVFAGKYMIMSSYHHEMTSMLTSVYDDNTISESLANTSQAATEINAPALATLLPADNTAHTSDDATNREPAIAAAMASGLPAKMNFQTFRFTDLMFIMLGLGSAFLLGGTGFRRSEKISW